ncbi:5'/3'-nucleotidase SurE [Synechococcus sp. UW105]|jgi:5'-nucleotidase|uniref:5'/3'-nucleotidase SurE n=1 Tax=unclassified Synechococcus TaxID=2626047 RepID=UPI000C8CB823|nr:5'/3'-nucleotidase SurE [Synechococcus sp. UW105]MAS27127.1 5'/3'-nucleotidase SurE [Synechococcus sp. NAT40]RZO10793.1 MAG: 5'/3'-nucleotidase SurE [Synechococcus sp. MED-G135]
MPPLRILISNDDGVFADGIKALALAAAARGHLVTVVCPDQERSATGHGLTLQQPIRAERADELFGQGVTAWACSGTPADCMKLALFELLDSPPDLVLSGINHGPNLGTDVFCSGTVAAAMEGTLEQLPAMAVSSACFQWRQFEGAGELALDVAESALRDGWPDNLLLNLNIPPCHPDAMGPLRWTRLSIRRYEEQFSPRKDPRGRTYYWLAGEAVEDLESGGDGPRDWPTDVAQIQTNAPSLTPIQPELFWRGGLSALPSINLSGQAVR